MKRKSIFGIAVLIIVGLTSCTIEKRHYRDGFYVDWNHHSAKTQETVALNEPTSSSQLPIRIVEAVDTSSSPVEVKQHGENSLVTNHHAPFVTSEKTETETPQDVTVNSEKSAVPTPIEKDKKQATGAGIAAAIFFILGMVGLVIKGTAPPTGIFIGAAFLCFILCVVLASFLYPRDPVVKQPKDEAVVVKDKQMAALGFGLVLGVFVLAVLSAALFLSWIL